MRYVLAKLLCFIFGLCCVEDARVVAEAFPQLTSQYNFADGSVLCNLLGSCNSADRVIDLDLSDLGFTGSISPELGTLSNLESLDFSYNQVAYTVMYTNISTWIR